MFLDAEDIQDRLYALIPGSWFPDLEDAPDLHAVLAMTSAIYANGNDGAVEFLRYLQRQTRIRSAEGFWLDFIAQDYFGRTIQRFGTESDSSFRRRILLNLLAPRGTRCALVSNITNLTGFVPKVIELRNTGDCGAYSSIGDPVWGGAVYNEIGAYGTMKMPYQLLINVTRPPGEGIPNVNGYSMPGGGYATYPKPFGYVGSIKPTNYGNGQYVELIDITGLVTDADIYDTVARTMPAGTTAWTNISSQLIPIPPGGGAMLDSNFYTDLSILSGDDAPVLGGALGNLYMTIDANGTVQQGDTFGIVTIPIFAHGNIQTVASNTLVALMTIPISANGSLFTGLSKWQIDIFATGAITQANQLVLTSLTSAMSLGVIHTSQSTALLSLVSPASLGTIAGTTAGIVSLTGRTSTTSLGTLSVQRDASISLNNLTTTAGPGVVSTTTLGNPFSADFSSDFGPITSSRSTAIGSLRSIMSLGSLTVTKSLSLSGLTSATVINAVSKQITPSSPSVTSTSSLGTLSVQTGVAQTWSTTHKDTNISVAGAVATHGPTVVDVSVYGAKTASSGKYYWELIVTCSDITQIAAGIGNTIAYTGDWDGSDLNSMGWVANNGEVDSNQVILQILPTWASGQRICFAIDLDNHLWWSRVGNGNWNGSSSANPATQSGGIPIPAQVYSSAVAPGVTLYANGDVGTGYFQPAQWVFVAPAGFGAW